jgi:hypothetical protein
LADPAACSLAWCDYGERRKALPAIKKTAFFDRLRILWIDRAK